MEASANGLNTKKLVDRSFLIKLIKNFHSKNKFLYFNINRSSHQFSSKDYFTSSFVIYDRNSSFGELIRYDTNSTNLQQFVDMNSLKNIKYEILDSNCEAINLNSTEWILIITKTDE